MSCGESGDSGADPDVTPWPDSADDAASVADAEPVADTVPDLPPARLPPLLQIATPAIPLMPTAADAIARAPAWLRPDLRIQFDMLFADQQEVFAALILGIEDPRILDEVAFMLAHVSPEILVDPAFYPELIVESAADLYAKDEVLDYVTPVDVGVPDQDDDFHTTATYTIETAEGDLEERTIDPDIYYWFVVHPRLEDEWPFYIDGWAQCLKQPTQCPVAPEEGQFWRTFLWDGALEGMFACPGYSTCPLLADFLVGEDVLWRSLPNTVDDNGALGGVTRFVLEALDFGAMAGERPIQPNRIYAIKWGNCGEHADLTSAAARTGLIPARNVGAHTNDHTWDEIWDGAEWIGMEPIGAFIGHKKYYGDNVFACTWTRGDSLVTTDSQTWGEAFDVEVTVTDEAGAPVDGARVLIYGAKDDGLWYYVYEAFSDIAGVARANIGRAHDYAMLVKTPFGDWPDVDSLGPLVTGPVEEDLFSAAVTVPGHKEPGPAPAEADLIGDATPEVELRLAARLDGTRTLQATYTYDTTFSRADERAPVLGFVTDAEGYAAFQAGDDPPAAAVLLLEGDDDVLSVAVPLDRDWVVVLANPGFLHTVVLGGATLTVTPLDGNDAGWPEALETPFEIPPGGHLALRLTPQGG
ncbi:MAG: transglutaminase domain-containing protein [Pseudomonadota bacterium]